MASAIAPVNDGDEPQHDPIAATPASRAAHANAPISSGVPGKTVRPSSSRWGSPALGCTITGSRVALTIRAARGSICSGPRPQFSPTASAPAASRITAAVSGSVPERSIRPLSPKVQLAHTGRSVTLFAASTAQRASAMSVIVSIKMASGFSAASAAACCGERREDLVEGRRAERLHHQAGGPHVREDVRRAGLPRDAHRSAVELFDAVGEAVLGELGRGSPEGVRDAAVRARQLVEVEHRPDHLGSGDVEQLGALPGGHAGALQHRAHGAVQHEHLCAESSHHVRHRYDRLPARPRRDLGAASLQRSLPPSSTYPR